MIGVEQAIHVADTLPHRNGEGYERTIIYANWDQSDIRRLARVQIRVDRSPVQSTATIDVWVPATGWQYVTGMGPEQFWHNMPGYTRAEQPAADRLTADLADELLGQLIETGI